MNEPGVTRGGPAGRRLAVGSQGGVVDRPVRPAVGVTAEAARIGPTPAALAGGPGADDPATSRPAASPASARPAGTTRRFTGTPRGGPPGPTRIRRPSAATPRSSRSPGPRDRRG